MYGGEPDREMYRSIEIKCISQILCIHTCDVNSAKLSTLCILKMNLYELQWPFFALVLFCLFILYLPFLSLLLLFSSTPTSRSIHQFSPSHVISPLSCHSRTHSLALAPTSLLSPPLLLALGEISPLQYSPIFSDKWRMEFGAFV